MKYIYDISAIAGLALLSSGIWVEFGWTYSAMVTGVIIMIAAIKGAMNDTRKAAE